MTVDSGTEKLALPRVIATPGGPTQAPTSSPYSGRLNHRLKTLTHTAPLVVDEIGYLSVRQSGAVLFFQLVNRRYERASTALTLNKGFEEWGQIPGDEVMAAALLDRVLHQCHIVNIRGNSYRLRHHAELSKAIHPTAVRAASAQGSGRRGA